METRREFTKMAFVAPAIVTLPVLASFARAGSDDGSGTTEAWRVIPVVYSDGLPWPQSAGYFVNPYPNTPNEYLIYPNGHTYHFEAGKGAVYIGMFGVDAILPGNFPAIVLGSTPLLLVPNL